jgi:hypothetical protein
MTYISSTELRESIVENIRAKHRGSTAFFGVDPPPVRRSGRIAAAEAAAQQAAEQRAIEAAARATLAAEEPSSPMPPPPPRAAPARRRAAAAVAAGGGAGAGGAAAAAGDAGGAAAAAGGAGGAAAAAGGAGGAVVRPPLTPPAGSAIDSWKRGDRFRIDLTALTGGEEFIITSDDYSVLHSFSSASGPDVAKASSLFNRIPEWTNVGGTNSEFRHGSSVLRRTHFLGAGTYGTAFDATYKSRNCVVKMVRLENVDKATDTPTTNSDIFLSNALNTIKETIIHVALMDTCMSYPEIREAQAKQKMARVPEIYGLFRTTGKGFVKGGDGALTSEDTVYIVIIMEKLDRALDSFLEDNQTDPIRLTTIGAVSLYQLASLFDVLGEVLEYNHRDMKLDNAMVKVSLSDKNMCGVPHFQAYIIDFGCSRLRYRGRDFICNEDLFSHSQAYNPAHDLTYAAWSYRYTVECKINLKTPCRKYVPVFDLVIQSILRASGINFDSAKHEYKSGLTAAFYTGLSDAGIAKRLEMMEKVKAGAFFMPQNIHPELIYPHGVKLLAKHVVRIIATMCHTASPSKPAKYDIATEEENVRALIRLQGLDENDDADPASDVSDA